MKSPRARGTLGWRVTHSDGNSEETDGGGPLGAAEHGPGSAIMIESITLVLSLSLKWEPTSFHGNK